MLHLVPSSEIQNSAGAKRKGRESPEQKGTRASSIGDPSKKGLDT
jgi:hypothetical protein